MDCAFCDGWMDRKMAGRGSFKESCFMCFGELEVWFPLDNVRCPLSLESLGYKNRQASLLIILLFSRHITFELLRLPQPSMILSLHFTTIKTLNRTTSSELWPTLSESSQLHCCCFGVDYVFK